MMSAVSLGSYPDLSERTYEVLKEQIVSGKVAPGSRLSVVDLAQQLDVSRTPVVSALTKLVAEGLVEEAPRRGYFVSQLNAEDVAHLMEVRLILELAAVERGIGAVDAAQIAEVRRQIDEMERCLDDEGRYLDYAQFIKKDSEFHLLIVSLARNPRLVEVYRGLNVHLAMVRIHFAVEMGHRRALPTVAEHRAIVAALAAHDLPALKAAIGEHVQGVMRSYDARA